MLCNARRILLLIMAVEVCNGVRTETNRGQIEKSQNTFLLNLTVIPLNYTIRIRPVLDEGFPHLERFMSQSSVTVRVRSITNGSCNTITMHQRNLRIHLNLVSVHNIATGRNLTIQRQSFDIGRDFYKITLKESFQFNEELEIYIPYSVQLSKISNTGIYVNQYFDDKRNKTIYYSATKLEPYHARKVFPVFDEPRLKARFRIIIGRLEGKYRSLSNMQIERTVPDSKHNGFVWDHFEDSIVMSPYLICMVVCDFENETIVLNRGHASERRISIWAPQYQIAKGGASYALMVATKMLKYYQEKFRMRFPLPKLDSIALMTYSTSATENFGLIAFRQKNLIWTRDQNTEAERRKVTQVMAHEIVHQWYGNIVTCAWWSDIWLNEGFARYFQFWGMNETIPEFEVIDTFVNYVTQLAMSYDHQTTLTHPMKRVVRSPTESSAMFDKIAYEKGAAMLKMMEGFMTRPVFLTGVIDIYLQRMKWKSAYQDDLFDAIQDAIIFHNATHVLPPKTTIKHIMRNWTYKSGYPLVRIEIVDANTISLSQEKFERVKRSETEAEETLWWIPIKLTHFHTTVNFWFSSTQNHMEYSASDLDTNKLIMANPDAEYYYRVLYDADLTELIRKQLLRDHSWISSASRSQLLDDYFYSAESGYISMNMSLGLTEYLHKESASSVWKSVLTHVLPIYYQLKGDSVALSLFKKYFLPKLEGALGIIGVRQWSGARGINVTLRARFLEIACLLKSQLCLEYAKELMLRWKMNPGVNPFPNDIRIHLYCPAIAASDQSSWHFLLEQFQELEIDHLAMALTCSQDASLLTKLLHMTTDNSTALTDYSSRILNKLMSEPETGPLVYKFAKESVLVNRISTRMFADVVSFFSYKTERPADLENLEQFMKANSALLEPVMDSLKRSLKQMTKACMRCSSWWKSFGRPIITWLSKHQPSTSF